MASSFAKRVIDTDQKYDLRKLKTPADKLGVPLFLITTDGNVLGEIIIIDCKYNQTGHSFFWQFRVLKKYQEIKKIKQQLIQGDWIRDVVIA